MRNTYYHPIRVLVVLFIFDHQKIQMGVYLQSPVKDKNINQAEGHDLSFVSAEMQGWRKTMEDAAIHELNIGDRNALFAVFDGHGGFEISEYVSRVFLQELTKLKAYQDKHYKQALNETFKNIDELIKSPEGQNQLRIIRYKNEKANQFEKEFIGGGVGCTANAVLITPTHFFVANAGDSRSVLCRAGKAFALSEDHKPQSQAEVSRITKAGGSVIMGRVNGGLNLTRSLGDFDYKANHKLPYDQQLIICKPDIVQFERSMEDEFILVGCDGIWERYVENSQEIIDIVRQQMKKESNKVKVVEDLMETLIAGDTSSGIGCDNMTAILISFQQ